ncbi:type II toxin-antitoxin system RelE/ParE family toxin [Pirellulales bacterium]|nr:type II toxin-antitoxin system RelE/ParE family toxin [Pirellulales bacterium]
MSAKKAKTRLLLTHRALSDIAEIEAFSIAEWGKRTAAKYINDLEAALTRLQERPDLLRPEEDFHSALRFYRVNKHLFVCDVGPKAIVLLTVIHASRDIPSRLAEMAPTLAAEVDLLHEQLRHGKKRSSS